MRTLSIALAVALWLALACASKPVGDPLPASGTALPSDVSETEGEGVPAPSRRAAALPDRGIWPDLDGRAALFPPVNLDRARTRIVIDKPHRVLTLLLDDRPVAAYPVALGFDPGPDKVREGDGRTPEGAFYVCEAQHQGLADRYGARSLRISYPEGEDARRGEAASLITPSQRAAIEKAVAARAVPPQTTPLGGSIRIHGGGVAKDWTLGCVTLRDEDVIEVYDAVRVGTPVAILGDGDNPPFGDADGDGVADSLDILLGAKKAAANGARYDDAYVKIPVSGGDVPREMGVCTDVVIRALRNAGFDLQTAVQADRRAAPAAYPRIDAPDPSIDHRRVKNLLVYFQRRWESRPTDDWADYRPGDVIVMDAGYYEGPDHTGIVSDRLGPSGRPMVINNWTFGYTTREMDLLGSVPVTHRFRPPAA